MHNCVLGPLQQEFSQAKILHDEIIELGGVQPGYYVVVDIPEQNLSRGYLIFLQPNQLVCLSCQQSTTSNFLPLLTSTQKQFRTELQ